MQRVGQVVVERGAVRSQKDGTLVAVDRCVQIALLPSGVSKMVVSFGMIRLQFQYAPQANLSLLKFPLLRKHIGEAVMCIHKAWRQRDRSSIAGGGCGQITLQEIGISKIKLIIGGSRIVLDGRQDQWNRDLILAGLLSDDPEQMERVGVLRFELQDLAVAGFGLRQSASPMVLQTNLQRFGSGSVVE